MMKSLQADVYAGITTSGMLNLLSNTGEDNLNICTN